MKVVVANGSRKSFGVAVSHSFFLTFFCLVFSFFGLFLWEGVGGDVFRNKSKFCFFLNLTGQYFITFCYCNNWAKGLYFFERKKNWV